MGQSEIDKSSDAISSLIAEVAIDRKAEVPIGIQLVAAYAGEDLLIRLASQLERAEPWSDRRPRVRA